MDGESYFRSANVKRRKKPPRKFRGKWENNIKINLIQIECKDEDWRRFSAEFSGNTLVFRIP